MRLTCLNRRTIPWLLCSAATLLAGLGARSSLGAAAAPDRLPESTRAPAPYEWRRLPPLPDPLGVAGPFVGVHNDALIVAGGANFPDGVPWRPTPDGGVSLKKYYDRIDVLERANDRLSEANSAYQWATVDGALPHTVAYGVSVSTPRGVVCIGGEWQEHSTTGASEKPDRVTTRSRDVFVMRWDPASSSVVVSNEWQFDGGKRPLPALPRGTTAACGALVGGDIYLAGGDTGAGGSRQFLRLDLSPPADGDAPWQWERLPSWPGPRRTHAIAVQQQGRFFLFSGRNDDPQDGYSILTDAYRFDPERLGGAPDVSRVANDDPSATNDSGAWRRIADIAPPGETPRCVMAGAGVAMGSDHVIVFGGARGDVLVRRENVLPRLIQDAMAQNDGDRVARLKKESDTLYDDHQGFSRDILSYNITTNAWAKLGVMPTTSPVTTTAVKWGQSVVIPSGETRPGVRTREVWAMESNNASRSLGAANWSVLGLYMVALVGVGFWFARGEKSSSDYFLGGGRVPWWAAGLSIFGTMLSAITYLAIPARSYATNWSWLLINLGIPVVACVVVFVYLPRIMRLRAASAYEFLECRFHISLRVLASASFVIFQLGRMGIVVLLPSLALSAATGADVYLCIVAIGLLSTLYTVLGGIEAVIWTDVVQVVVLLGGAAAALAIMTSAVDGGMASILTAAASEGKLALANPPVDGVWNWEQDNVVVVLLAAFFINLIPYTSDQAVLQRYLAVNDERKARQALWTNAWLAVPASLLFFLLGTCLWYFYRSFPEKLIPLKSADQVFPWFIAQEMPPGLAGLVIAGVFAAAMSSLDSSMHSAATVLTTDFYQRLAGKPESLRFARAMTVLLGIVGAGSAMVLASADIRFLWDLFQAVIGLCLGAVGGLFSLGILTQRVGALHAWIGVMTSFGVLAYVHFATELNGLLNGTLAVTVCVLVGYVSSLAVPLEQRRLVASQGASS